MADNEKKKGQDVSADTQPNPNQGPSQEELEKQNQELLNQIKERDSKIQELETTSKTIQARIDEIAKAGGGKSEDVSAQKRRIMERAQYDPDGAQAELDALLSDLENSIVQKATNQAITKLRGEAALEKLKAGVAKANPEFDEDMVELVIDRANMLAAQEQVKTAAEAVEKATQYIKAKLEAYASKKQPQPLPSGASAETGPNKPPEAPKPEPVETPEQEIDKRKEELQKKIL